MINRRRKKQGLKKEERRAMITHEKLMYELKWWPVVF